MVLTEDVGVVKRVDVAVVENVVESVELRLVLGVVESEFVAVEDWLEDAVEVGDVTSQSNTLTPAIMSSTIAASWVAA